MEDDKLAVINVATEVKIINITYVTGWTAEDLCIKVSRQTDLFAFSFRTMLVFVFLFNISV